MQFFSFKQVGFNRTIPSLVRTSLRMNHLASAWNGFNNLPNFSQ